MRLHNASSLHYGSLLLAITTHFPLESKHTLLSPSGLVESNSDNPLDAHR